MNPVFVETGLLDNFYAIYNLQCSLVYHLEYQIFKYFISRNKIILNYFAWKWMKPHVIVQWKKRDNKALFDYVQKNFFSGFKSVKKRETPVFSCHNFAKICIFFKFFVIFEFFYTNLLTFWSQFKQKFPLFTAIL